MTACGRACPRWCSLSVPSDVARSPERLGPEHARAAGPCGLAEHLEQGASRPDVRVIGYPALEVRQQVLVSAGRAPDHRRVTSGADDRNAEREAWLGADGPTDFVYASDPWWRSKSNRSSPRRWSKNGPEDRRVNQVDVDDVVRAREVLAEREIDTITRARGRTVECQRELGICRGRQDECNQRCDEDDSVTFARHGTNVSADRASRDIAEHSRMRALDGSTRASRPIAGARTNRCRCRCDRVATRS